MRSAKCAALSHTSSSSPLTLSCHQLPSARRRLLASSSPPARFAASPRGAHPSDASGHRSPRRNDDCGGNGPARPSAALYGYEHRVPRVERPLPVRSRDRGSGRRGEAGSPQRRRRAQGGSGGGAGSGVSGGG